jgi:hypothetical protein
MCGFHCQHVSEISQVQDIAKSPGTLILQKKFSSMEKSNDLPKLAKPAERALAAAGIKTLDQLSGYTEQEVSSLHGMGPNALGKLRQALADRGMGFSRGK